MHWVWCGVAGAGGGGSFLRGNMAGVGREMGAFAFRGYRIQVYWRSRGELQHSIQYNAIQ